MGQAERRCWPRRRAEFQYYDDTAAAQLALQSGRADVEFNPNAQLAYRAVVSGNTRLVGIVNGGWPLTAEIAVATKEGAASPMR